MGDSQIHEQGWVEITFLGQKTCIPSVSNLKRLKAPGF